MVKYASIVEAKCIDENKTHYFVQYKGETFAVNKSHLDEELTQGSIVEGMIFEDRNGTKVLQVDLPDIRPGYYGWGEVVDIRRDLGVFVDVGLDNKDVVVSLDVLPEDRTLWPKKGNLLYLTYEVDGKNRFWGRLADQEVFHKSMQKGHSDRVNADVTARVYRIGTEGVNCFTTENYDAFIHQSELLHPVSLGDKIQARIIGVRLDGRVNLSTLPRAHEAIDGDAKMIYTLLNQLPSHYLPLHDKSSPETIREQLDISKGQFKRAVGHLLKERLIFQKIGDGIYLKQDDVKDNE